MKYKDVNRAVVMSTGGKIICTNANGEPQWEVGFLPGVHECKQLLTYMRPGDELHEQEGCQILLPGVDRVKRLSMGRLSVESGANADFRPSRLSNEELRLRKTLQKVQTASNSLEKRMKTFERLNKEAEQAAAVEETGVIEDVIEEEEAPQERRPIKEEKPEKPRRAATKESNEEA